MKRSKLPYFFLGLAAVLAISALVLLVLRPGVESAPVDQKTTEIGKNSTAPNSSQPNKLGRQRIPDSPSTTPKDPEPAPLPSSVDPAELVNRIAKALEKGDLATIEGLLGKNALGTTASDRLKALAAAGIKLHQPNGIREVGEIDLNSRTRWELELDGLKPGHNHILLDLKKVDGKWVVEKITLPPEESEPGAKADLTDSLEVADVFLQAVLRQDFEFARGYVDPATVSDAKIAGLCILFEEGQYHLRKAKPLRSMFQRPGAAGFLANVEAADGTQNAQFSITLVQPTEGSKWRVTEINLDQLLADYAQRVAGGDVYYSPLVKNPGGGDTLALYFGFDEDQMNPRTRRQLEIVSLILRADPGRKITLSGHTDSLGTDSYNQGLSSRRADIVRDYLVKAGVSSSQIVTIGKGSSQPRRPNVTETGQDNPEGRRTNRRTEIYLDF